MNNETIEVEASMISDLMPCLTNRLELLTQKREELDGQIDAMKHTIATLAAKLNGRPSLQSLTPKGRKRKGTGDNLIVVLLNGLPEGQGLTMPEIEKATGVNHSTVYRTLNDAAKNRGRFIADGKLWKIKK